MPDFMPPMSPPKVIAPSSAIPSPAPPGIMAMALERKTGIGVILLAVLGVCAQAWPSLSPVWDSITATVQATPDAELAALPGKIADLEARLRSQKPADLGPIEKRLQALEMAPPELTLSPYETSVRLAWSQEIEPDRAVSLRQTGFLLRRTNAEAMGQWKDLKELYDSFRTEEKALSLDTKLLLVRAAIRAEWPKQVPEIAPLPLTEPLRVRVCDFLRQTVGILERLP